MSSRLSRCGLLRQASREFYRWGSILRAAGVHETPWGKVRHAAYAGGWKKFEPLWDAVIRGRRLAMALPLLERVLGGGSGAGPVHRDEGGPSPAPGFPFSRE